MKPNLLTAALMGAALLTGCKKEYAPANPAPVPNEVNPRVAIKLNAGYVSSAKIDSATLVWETAGQVQEAKLQLSNDTLFAETANLTKGAGCLTVQIFSKVQLRQQNLQWERRVDVTMKEKASINWPAPAGYDDTAWQPRVILMHHSSPFTAIIALRPADPYFLLKNVPPGYKIELDRIYTRLPGGAQIIAGGTWKCNTVCTDAKGNIENREFFRFLPTQIAGREWKGIETGVGLFGPNNTSGPVVYFNYYY